MSLSQIVYVSRSPCSTEDVELDQFSMFAKQHHPALDVTGALVVDRGTLLHFLEGPPKSVESLFSVMTHFPFHRHPIAIHWDEDVSSRLFPHHPLAIARIDHDAGADITALWHQIDASSIICGGGRPSGCMELLDALSRNHQSRLRLTTEDD
jgi:Sensors of blue-light using FAD